MENKTQMTTQSSKSCQCPFNLRKDLRRKFLSVIMISCRRMYVSVIMILTIIILIIYYIITQNKLFQHRILFNQ